MSLRCNACHYLEQDAQRLHTKIRSLRVIDMFETLKVPEVPSAVHSSQPSKIFKVQLKVYVPHRYSPHLNLEFQKNEVLVREQFKPRLMKEMKKSFQPISRKRKEDIIQVLRASKSEEGTT